MQANNKENQELIFLKLGGSLITKKSKPRTPRMKVIQRLADEILQTLLKYPHIRLLVGHGSGSFGHVPANQYKTRQGVKTIEEWKGFLEVWQDASNLNRIVVEAFINAGLPVITFPPSAIITASNGKVRNWDVNPIRNALNAGLIPIIYGDVVFDTILGGTILSTEDLFDYLAFKFNTKKILMATIEEGIWADYPEKTRLMENINQENFAEIESILAGSISTDVTGGMASKVKQSLAMVNKLPGLEVFIFSGDIPYAIEQIISGAELGTKITSH